MLLKKLTVAATFALLLASGAALAGGDAAKGEELSVDCADCHGADGKGDDETPALAGLDAAEISKQLHAYKSGERKDEDDTMTMFAEDLSDQDIEDLAAYYASLPSD